MASELTRLASEVCKREGKKSNVKIGDVREILKHIITMEAEHKSEGDIYKDSPIDILDKQAAQVAAKMKKKKK